MDDLVSRQKVLRCIKESRENIDWGQSEDGDAFLHYSAALYRTIASKDCLPSAQQWIPCSKWLPEEEGQYLVTLDFEWGKEIEMGDWFNGEWVNPNSHVTVAWMELPTPWKESEDEETHDIEKKYEAKVITRGNCMMCGKELTEGLFLCKECEAKAIQEK